MTLSQLIYFKELAQSQHYTSTAELLDVAQSSLSRSISAQEEELGVFLFEKQGRNIRLTRYGEAYYRYVQEALNTLDTGRKYVQDMADPDCGEINLGSIYSLGPRIMPEIIQGFTARPENQRFRIRMTQGSTAGLVEQLRQGKCDLILCSPPDTGDHGLELTAILQLKFVVLVSSRNPLSAKDHISLRELSQYSLVVSPEQITVLRRLFKYHGASLNVLSEIQGDCAAVRLASINYGIAILSTVADFMGLDVKALSIDELEDYRFPLYMAQMKHRWLSPAVAAFRKFLLEQVEQSRLSSLTEA